ncbi:hypothetical protein RSOLAG22IIIB_13111 [Rhizoctonia solani]|uniref:Phytocyanin domain-containing protein n=1 Tax=Rhizoctonia solani TaxID=456999 RepID=A0A0K6GIF4_9AGAM|nr:hypothetical protein RSOLAG22IIIB_13111 [Rhizoctonia solani]
MMFNFAAIITVLAFVLPIIANPVPRSNIARTEWNDNDWNNTEWHEPKTYKVTVGANGNLRYDPEYVHAKVGDYIKFEFHPKNHTVTESSFNKPCYAIDQGFSTGFVPVASEDSWDLPTRKFKVIDEKPHWFYCEQIGHCPAGMVFAVNPPKEGNTFEKFQQLAIKTGNDTKW